MLKKMKNHPNLPELDWNQPEQLFESIRFLKDFFRQLDAYQNPGMSESDRKQELMNTIRLLIWTFVRHKKWMGISTR